jgi:hypothetical protein
MAPPWWTALRALVILATVADVARADVVSSLQGSHLFLTGDAAPDSIAITPSDGSIAVSGFDGTLVDGSSDQVTFAGVRRITIRLMSGADRLLMTWVTLPGVLDIGMGKGNDVVDLDEVWAGPLRIATSQGYDVVNVFGPSFFESASIRTGNGNDHVVVDTIGVDGSFDLIAGDDEDFVSIAGIEVYDDVHVKLGGGDDVLWFGDAFVAEDTHLDGGSGDNWLDLFGYLNLWDDVDIDGFGDDWCCWWWW